MNFSQSFEEFSRGLTNTDLMVYGGAGLVLFVLFQKQLVPVKDYLVTLYNNLINKVKTNTKNVTSPIIYPVVKNNNDNDFLQLIASWKNTRNLSENMGCEEAVKILDSAFSHLAPHECMKQGNKI